MTSSKKKLFKVERKHQIQRRLIIQGAQRLFEKHPYDDVSMDHIADEAAVSKQTLYNYFDSKEAIFFGMGIEGLKESIERTEALGLAKYSGKEQVLILSEAFFNALMKNPLSIQITRRFAITNDQMNGIADKLLQERLKGKQKKIEKKRDIEDVITDYLEHLRAYEEYWIKAIRTGFKDKTITSNLKPNQLMYYAFGMLIGIVDQMQLKWIPMERAELDQERFRQITMRLMENLLQSKM